MGGELDRVASARVVDDDLRPDLQRGVELLLPQIDVGRRKDGALHVVAKVLEASGDVVEKLLGSRPYPSFPDDERVFRQVIEKGSQLIEEEGQVVLDPVWRDPFADVLVDAAPTHVHIEGVVPVASEPGYRLFVEGKFLCRQQAHGVHLLDGALRIRVKGAQAFHLVVEQVDADGQIRTHGVDVHQRSAYGVLTVDAYRLRRRVSGRVEAASLGVHVEALARAQ